MEPICYIVGAMAETLGFRPEKGDLLIAADAGLPPVQRAGLTPDLIVGDFDSLGYVPEGENVIRHPVKKDDTDMMLAVKLGLARGYRVFYLCGGVGGRTDHTVANLQTLAYLARHGAAGFLFAERDVMTVVGPGRLRFSPDCRGVFSAFAFGGEAAGVTLTNLLYTLDDAVLTPFFPLAVSNEFTGRAAEVSFKSGALLLSWSAGNPLPDRI